MVCVCLFDYSRERKIKGEATCIFSVMSVKPEGENSQVLENIFIKKKKKKERDKSVLIASWVVIFFFIFLFLQLLFHDVFHPRKKKEGK